MLDDPLFEATDEVLDKEIETLIEADKQATEDLKVSEHFFLVL